MFGDFLKRLMQPETDELPDEDARLALTALLVRIARADHDYSADEKARIDRINARRYNLGPGAVKDAVPYEERLCVVRAMWEVVLADGARAEEEDALVRMASNFLGISDRDSALVRQGVDSGA